MFAEKKITMYGLLKKDEAVPLPDQISNIIRKKIVEGEYHPGKRLGSIRQFAKDFDVSPVTIIKALDILEDETLIERVPAKGIFVSMKLKLRKKILNGCYVFPEKVMLPAPNGNENWSLNYELYRGLFDAAHKHKVNMQFVYFKDNPTAEVLEKQKLALKNFDFAIFPGPRQLAALCNASAMERPTYCFNYSQREAEFNDAVIDVDYDRENVVKYLLEYLVQSGCGSAGAISSTVTKNSRAIEFLDEARSRGIKAAPSSWLKLEYGAPDAVEKIKEYLLNHRSEFIFVDYTEVMSAVYEAACRADLTVGKDFILTGVASGVTFAGLFPRISYFRIPRYEMGVQIIESAEKLISSGKKTGTISPLKLEFIKGYEK